MKPPSTLNCSLQALDFQQAWSPLDFVTPGHTSRPFEFLRKLLSPFPFLFPSRHMRAYIIIESKVEKWTERIKEGKYSGKVFGCGTRWSSNSKGEGGGFQGSSSQDSTTDPFIAVPLFSREKLATHPGDNEKTRGKFFPRVTWSNRDRIDGITTLASACKSLFNVPSQLASLPLLIHPCPTSWENFSREIFRTRKIEFIPRILSSCFSSS